jgi:hypothetical protein
MTKVAYCISIEDEGSEIVFAESEEAATYLAYKIGTGGYSAEDLDQSQRIPEYDKYAAQGYVPIEVLYNDGWSFECSECGRTVSDSTGEDNYQEELAEWEADALAGEEAPPVYNPQFIDSSSLVFCSVSCKDKFYKESELKKTKKLKAKAYLEKRFPEITNIDIWGDFTKGDIIARFNFPGGKGSVKYDFKKPNTVMVNPDDLETWKEYSKVTK